MGPQSCQPRCQKATRGTLKHTPSLTRSAVHSYNMQQATTADRTARKQRRSDRVSDQNACDGTPSVERSSKHTEARLQAGNRPRLTSGSAAQRRIDDTDTRCAKLYQRAGLSTGSRHTAKESPGCLFRHSSIRHATSSSPDVGGDWRGRQWQGNIGLSWAKEGRREAR